MVMCGECESFDAKRSEHLCPKDIPLVPLQVEEAFSGLSPSERLYAHHFSQACWAGIPIVAAQTSPESPLLLELIARMFSGGTAALRANLSPEFPAEHWGDLLDFCAFCVGNLGNFKAIGDSKVVPRLPLDSFAAAVSATGNDRALELWSQVQAAVYSPEGAIADGYYTGGASAAEDGKLVGLALEERREEAWNTRVEKRASDGTLIIRSASVREQEEEPFEFRGVRMARATGDHSAALANVVTHLRRALPHAPSAHASAMLRALTEHFTDGAIDLHKQASAEWVKDDPAVETTIGFIETDRDPQGVRAEFEGFVAVRNAVMSAKFARLVAFAPTLLSRLPWGAEFERDTFQAPAFTSLDVLSFCSGSLPLGICLPSAPLPPQHVITISSDLERSRTHAHPGSLARPRIRGRSPARPLRSALILPRRRRNADAPSSISRACAQTTTKFAPPPASRTSTSGTCAQHAPTVPTPSSSHPTTRLSSGGCTLRRTSA